MSRFLYVFAISLGAIAGYTFGSLLVGPNDPSWLTGAALLAVSLVAAVASGIGDNDE